jgi:hypothetical protein
MQRESKIILIFLIILSLVAISYFSYFIYEKIAVKKEVKANCGKLSNGDEWVGCVIEMALAKNDARYCKSESVFSPYPGICMEAFSRKTEKLETCKTISKPRYKRACEERF